MTTGKRGRPGRDWDTLFKEWVASGLSKAEFLQAKGISISAGSTKYRTQHWADGVKEIADGMTARYLNETKNKTKVEEVDNTVAFTPAEVEEILTKPDPTEPESPKSETKQAEVVPITQNLSTWQLIMRWRNKQAGDDFRGADELRMHIKMLLKQSVQVLEGEDGKKQYKTLLTAVQMRAIGQTLSDIQRVQRLALGLSTENLGIDQPDSHVEKPKENNAGPRFVVEMSKNGKFIRPRPRRVD